jgi:hypothetical protein
MTEEQMKKWIDSRASHVGVNALVGCCICGWSKQLFGSKDRSN